MAARPEPPSGDARPAGETSHVPPPPARLGSLYRTVLSRELGLHKIPAERALDIGGWDGYWAAQLAVRPLVLDITPSASSRSLTYVAGDALALPFGDDSFDLVYAFDVVEHVPDERRLLAEAARVLKPAGRIVVSTPQADTRIAPRILQSWADKKWGHDRVRGFQPAYIREALEDAGFTDVRVRPLTIRRFRWLYLPLSVLWRVWPRLARRCVVAIARRDAHGPEGGHGWLVATAQRGAQPPA